MFDRLFDLVIQFLQLFQFWVVIDEYEEGVVLTFGRPRRARFLGITGSHVLSPGLHWKWPINIDVVHTVNVVPTTTNLIAQSLTTADGVSVVVSAVVTWRIKDSKRMILEVEEPQRALADSTYSVIARLVGQATWDEMKTVSFRRSILRRVRTKASVWGIGIDDVSLVDKVKTRTIRLVQE